MHKLVWICMLGLCAGVAFGGTCSQSYRCQKTCYRTSTYYIACGWFGWDWARCSRQRTVPYSCTKTCHRRVCCAGYTGSDCNTPICFGSTSCRNGGTCSSPDTCRCLSGFSSPQCNDVNECTQTNHGCQQGCVNTNGSYRCTCRSGYTLDTNLKGCLDMNECISKNGRCEQVCKNNIGSFTCDCRKGYKLNTDGRTCSDIDECDVNNGNCDHICINQVGSYSCECFSGYKMADGSSMTRNECQDLDECDVNNGNCDHICINQAGSYRCECFSGYRMVEGSSMTRNECQDLQQKYEAIQKLDKGIPAYKVVEEQCVGKTQIQNLRKRKIEVISDFENNVPMNTKRRIMSNEKINDLTLARFEDAVKRKIVVTGPLLKTKALDFASKLNISEFQQSNIQLHDMYTIFNT